MRPGQQVRYQAGRKRYHTPDTLPLVWNAWDEKKKVEDILHHEKVRAPRYAQRTIPRKPYEEPLVPMLHVGGPDGFASETDTDTTVPPSTSNASASEDEDASESDGADPLVDHCELVQQASLVPKLRQNKQANKCKSVFCGFVRHKKKHHWYHEKIPCMLLKEQEKDERDKRGTSDEDAYPDDDCPHLS